MKKIFIVLLILIILVAISGFVFRDKINDYIVSYNVSNFEECEAYGFPVAESFPRQCFPPAGKSYTEVIPTIDPDLSPTPSIIPSPYPTHESIVIVSPRAGSLVSEKITIVGRAKGEWFFEGVFPVAVVSDSGEELAQTLAVAQEDSYSADYVPFTATVTVNIDENTVGYIEFQKDNPSGLPENSMSYQIPIIIENSEL